MINDSPWRLARDLGGALDMKENQNLKSDISINKNGF